MLHELIWFGGGAFVANVLKDFLDSEVLVALLFSPPSLPKRLKHLLWNTASVYNSAWYREGFGFAMRRAGVPARVEELLRLRRADPFALPYDVLLQCRKVMYERGAHDLLAETEPLGLGSCGVDLLRETLLSWDLTGDPIMYNGDPVSTRNRQKTYLELTPAEAAEAAEADVARVLRIMTSSCRLSPIIYYELALVLGNVGGARLIRTVLFSRYPPESMDRVTALCWPMEALAGELTELPPPSSAFQAEAQEETLRVLVSMLEIIQDGCWSLWKDALDMPQARTRFICQLLLRFGDEPLPPLGKSMIRRDYFAMKRILATPELNETSSAEYVKPLETNICHISAKDEIDKVLFMCRVAVCAFRLSIEPLRRLTREEDGAPRVRTRRCIKCTLLRLAGLDVLFFALICRVHLGRPEECRAIAALALQLLQEFGMPGIPHAVIELAFLLRDEALYAAIPPTMRWTDSRLIGRLFVVLTFGEMTPTWQDRLVDRADLPFIRDDRIVSERSFLPFRFSPESTQSLDTNCAVLARRMRLSKFELDTLLRGSCYVNDAKALERWRLASGRAISYHRSDALGASSDLRTAVARFVHTMIELEEGERISAKLWD